MNRRQVNQEIDRIITSHRDAAGGIPPLSVALLRRDLVAHMDETVKAALNETTT